VKLSARNVLKGKVKSIVNGALNSEVVIELAGGTPLVSVITKSSVEGLNLKVGMTAYAVVKASDVLVGTD
jgi:molybdopterin-binding protein